MARVLLVDDEGEALLSLSRVLKSIDSSLHIEGAPTSAQALEIIEKNDFHVAVIDLSLDSRKGVESGFELLRTILNMSGCCRVIVLTGHSSVDNGVRALNTGASHFLEKPPDVTHLYALIKDCARQSEIFRAYQSSSKGLNSAILSQELIGNSKVIEALREEVLFAAATNQSVFLIGETGTGKTLCASLIHRLSARSRNKFICYTPGYQSADLVNSDLYGHLKGSFTGAAESRTGLLREADRGTFFLDEVDELPQDTQISLLRVLQSRTFRSLGSNKEEQSDFRLIAASNRLPEELLEKKKLREDFYHRIAHKVIRIPSLRERKSDIGQISAMLLQFLNKREQLRVVSIEQAAVDKLVSYDWPGNVRELQAVVEGAAYLAQFRGKTAVTEFELQIDGKSQRVLPEAGSGFHAQVESYKLKLISEAMEKTAGNQVQACKLLGLDRSGLRRILGRE